VGKLEIRKEKVENVDATVGYFSVLLVVVLTAAQPGAAASEVSGVFKGNE
jgi:hypothetical protein